MAPWIRSRISGKEKGAVSKRNAKEYLMRVTYQKYALEQIEADILEAENDAYGLSSVPISERVQTSHSPEWMMSAAVGEVNRLKALYEKEAEKYIDIKREVKEAVRVLPNRQQAYILEMRYCRCMRLSDIANMIKKKEGYVRRMHGEALDSFRNIHNMD